MAGGGKEKKNQHFEAIREQTSQALINFVDVTMPAERQQILKTTN